MKIGKLKCWSSAASHARLELYAAGVAASAVMTYFAARSMGASEPILAVAVLAVAYMLGFLVTGILQLMTASGTTMFMLSTCLTFWADDHALFTGVVTSSVFRLMALGTTDPLVEEEGSGELPFGTSLYIMTIGVVPACAAIIPYLGP